MKIINQIQPNKTISKIVTYCFYYNLHTTYLPIELRLASLLFNGNAGMTGALIPSLFFHLYMSTQPVQVHTSSSCVTCLHFQNQPQRDIDGKLKWRIALMKAQFGLLSTAQQIKNVVMKNINFYSFICMNFNVRQLRILDTQNQSNCSDS